MLLQVANELRLDIEVLLAAVLGKPRSFIYAHPEYVLTGEELAQVRKNWRRREAGEPLAYILENKEFWGLNFKVNQHTLIPRPETERLVETVLAYFSPATCRFIDIGTGCGAIACAVASERPNWQITATDINPDTLAVAKQNSRRLGIKNIHFILSDLFLELSSQRFDCIVSNPPYISENDPHLRALNYEPQQALVAEDKGFALLKQLISQAVDYLNPGGLLILEHGYDQATELRLFSERQALTWVQTYNDYSGLQRVSLFKAKS